MPTFTGYLNATSELASVQQQGSPAAPWDKSYPLVALDLEGPILGSKQLHQPINQIDRTTTGWINYSFFDDYYNRVWFLPSVVDFGPLTSETTFPVYMWNAHLIDKTLEGINVGTDDSVRPGGINLPLHLNALAGTYFNVIASINGDPTIDTEFGFTFDPLEFVSLPILGIRARLWPFRVNWKDGFETTLDYKTDIIQAGDGTEQRIATRQTPRKAFRFTSLVNEGDWRTFVRQMNVWQGRATIVAEYPKFARLSATAIDGQGFLTVEEVPDWLVPGTLLVLMEKGREPLLRTVDDISGNLVALTGIVSGEWRAGLKVFKGLSGRLNNSISASQYRNNTAVVTLNFDADPGREIYPDAGVPDVVHRGREVLLKRPNWREQLQPSFEVAREIVDYGTGRIDQYLPFEFSDRYHKATYLGRNSVEVDEIERFFRRQMGQQGEFFMPTWTEDIQIMSPVEATTSNLRVAGPMFGRDYADDPVYRDLIIWFHDGTYLLRTVQSIYEVTDIIGNDSNIQVTEPFPFAFTPESISQICWMPLWRLASDGITLAHVTNTVAEFALTMKTLPYEAPE